MICSKLPTCKLGAVQSKPIYALIDLLMSKFVNLSLSVHWWKKPLDVISFIKLFFIENLIKLLLHNNTYKLNNN